MNGIPNRRWWHVTPNEMREIRRRVLAGERTMQIALQMHLTRNTVALAKKKMGLPVLPPVPAKKILALLLGGIDQRQIARILKFSYRRIRAFARAHGFARPRRTLTAAQVLAIDEAILNRQASAISIARKHNASYKYVLQRAHAVLACETFLPTWKRPLESYFPSRPPRPIRKRASEDGTASASRFLELLSRIFPGGLPVPAEHDSYLVAALLFAFEKSFGLQDLSSLRGRVSEAVSTLRQASTTVH